MKVIDLLKIMADDVNVPPKRIKYNDRIFEYKLWLEPSKYAYVEEGTNNTLEEYCCFYDLNDEVEIIEENKNIEKLEHWIDIKSWVKGNDLEKGLEEQSNFNKNIYYKINEIIDIINKGDK